MKTYFSTFITGTQEIVEELLLKRKAKIKLLLDGLVVYESNYSYREIRNLHFLNNTFLLLHYVANINPTIKALEGILLTIIKDKNIRYEIDKNLPKKRNLFKIVTSLENQTVAVNRNLLQKVEAIVASNKNLKLNIRKPNLEFLAMIRREGYGFFGIRITYPYKHRHRRGKGELRREIAHIMCALSKPNPKDIVLDPFAGYGAIPIERSKSFPYQEIMGIEQDKKVITILKENIKNAKKEISVFHGNALSMDNIENASINKIITDPPWGIYENIKIPLSEFYDKTIHEFLRVLKDDGIIIMLIGQPEIFDDVTVRFQNKLEIKKRYKILVSGKKATIYKIKKIVH